MMVAALSPLIPVLGCVWKRQTDLWVQGQHGLQSEFQDSQGYTEKQCLEKQKPNQLTKHTAKKQTQNLQQKNPDKHSKTNKLARRWWHSPLIPELGRQRQADFWDQGQPVLQSELYDSQGYTEKPCLKTNKQTNKKMCVCAGAHVYVGGGQRSTSGVIP